MAIELLPVTNRLSTDDTDRSDKLAAMIPSLSRTALAREALRREELFDDADEIKDPSERDAALARLAGIIGSRRGGKR